MDSKEVGVLLSSGGAVLGSGNRSTYVLLCSGTEVSDISSHLLNAVRR